LLARTLGRNRKKAFQRKIIPTGRFPAAPYLKEGRLGAEWGQGRGGDGWLRHVEEGATSEYEKNKKEKRGGGSPWAKGVKLSNGGGL